MPKPPHTRRLEEGGGMQHFREALAAVLVEDIELPRGALVTVLDAKVTRDTSHAKGVLSVLPTSMEKDVLQSLGENVHEIKRGLAARLRLRRIPDIYWSFDDTEEHAASIDRTIEDLHRNRNL